MILGACSTSNNYHDFAKNSSKENANETLLAPPLIAEGFELQEIDTSDIFALSPEHQKHFLDYYNAASNRSKRPHERVYKYLERNLSNFDYRGDTYNAQLAIDKRSGNCLSLAILSTAFTKLAKLNYKYNLVHAAPIFEEYGNLQILSSHVNLTIYDEPRDQAGIVLMPAKVVIDYFRTSSSVVSSKVSETELQIMYWHNLTGDALLDGDLDKAFTYTKQAYDLDPLYPETLNFLAILYNRRGFSERAYQLYDFMLTNKLYTFTAIDNFASLLRSRGETARADSIAELVVHINNDNPYTWMHRGIKSAEQNDYRLAENYFKKSIKLGPYLHQPQFQLAKLYAQQNKIRLAKDALEKAFELAYKPDDQQRYEAKLFSLKQGQFSKR